MATIQWDTGTYQAVMGDTELGGLTNNEKVLSIAISNTTNSYLFDDVEWHHETLGSTPSNGAVIELYIIQEQLDGSGYEDGDASTDPSFANLVGVFNIATTTDAQTHILRQITIPPSNFKYLVINKTGVTLPSSGNYLRRKPYRYQTQN